MNIDMKNASFLIGTIGSVEVTTFGPKNTKKMTLSVVQDDGRYKNGKWEPDETWIDVEAFNGVAEYAEKFCKKGKKIGISAKLKQERWKDKDTGQSRCRHYLKASQITRLFKEGEEQGQSPDHNQMN